MFTKLKYQMIEKIYRILMSDNTPGWVQIIFLNRGAQHLVSEAKATSQK